MNRILSFVLAMFCFTQASGQHFELSAGAGIGPNNIIEIPVTYRTWPAITPVLNMKAAVNFGRWQVGVGGEMQRLTSYAGNAILIGWDKYGQETYTQEYQNLQITVGQRATSAYLMLNRMLTDNVVRFMLGVYGGIIVTRQKPNVSNGEAVYFPGRGNMYGASMTLQARIFRQMLIGAEISPYLYNIQVAEEYRTGQYVQEVKGYSASAKVLASFIF